MSVITPQWKKFCKCATEPSRSNFNCDKKLSRCMGERSCHCCWPVFLVLLNWFLRCRSEHCKYTLSSLAAVASEKACNWHVKCALARSVLSTELRSCFKHIFVKVPISTTLLYATKCYCTWIVKRFRKRRLTGWVILWQTFLLHCFPRLFKSMQHK